MSAAALKTGTYIFYFSLETNNLRFCFANGNGDTLITTKEGPITASKGNTSLAAVANNGTQPCGECGPMQHNRSEANIY